MSELLKLLLAGAAVVLVFMVYRDHANGSGSSSSSTALSIGSVMSSLNFAGENVGFGSIGGLNSISSTPQTFFSQ